MPAFFSSLNAEICLTFFLILRKVVWCLIFLLFLPFSVSAQQSSAALKAALKTASENMQADSVGFYVSALGEYYLNKQAYDSSRYYYLKAYACNRAANNKAELAKILNNLGVLYFQTGSLDSGIFFYNEAYGHYSSLGDSAMITILDINLGMLYKEKGLYEKSLEYLLSSARKLEKKEVSAHLASCYNTIGSVYLKIGELHSSITYHYKALEVKQKIGSYKSMASSYNNIGNVYLLMKQYDSALNNFKKSLDIKRAHNDKFGEATSLNNMGELMVKIGNLKMAEEFFVEALAIKVATQDNVGQVVTLKNLAQVYLLSDNLDEAEQKLDESETLANRLGLLEQLKDIYQTQVALHKRKGNPDKALSYSQQLLVVKDSLLNLEKAQVLAEMQTRYESMKKEDRIALLEKEGLLQAVALDRKQIWIRSLVLAMVLTLIIGVLIYYNLRTVRKNKIHIELLLKELHHRVKNNLQILSSLLSLQSQQLTDDTAIKAVKSSESRINAMALIHRKLYTVDQNRTVDIKEYITELIQYLVYSYGYHEKNFKLDLEIREISIDVDKAIPLGLILNELISNAFKHAYENQPNPRLMVNLAYPGSDHELSIRITDNGGGMPAVDEKQRKTFGMKIVSTLIKELKGSLDVKSDNGTTYDLHIPI
jgi:two-component sensor histidine kinase